MPRPPKLTGLQRDVLSLYRACLRTIRQKPTINQPHFYEFARREFEKGRGVDKKDFGAVEFMLRRGRRMMETYGEGGVRDVR